MGSAFIVTLSPFLHGFARPAQRADEFINIVRGDGAAVYDADGKRYVEGMASLWYCQIGYGRAAMGEAIGKAASQLGGHHTFDIFTNPYAEAVAAEVAALAPMADARVFLTSGGSESVDSAIKLARQAHTLAGRPDRTVILSRTPSYHGMNYGGLAATGIAAHKVGFGTMLSDVHQAPHDDLDAIGALCAQHSGKLAAIIAEPVIGAPGVYPPKPGYLAGLRALADQHGAFLIFDEVICGFGRLGQWWGAQHFGVTPDMVTFAKGVTSGYAPLGGVLVGPAVRAPLEADTSFLLRHGFTYSGHPVACAAGVANLEILKDEGLIDRAKPVGERLSAGLRGVAATHADKIAEVRGDGAVWAVGVREGVDPAAIRKVMLQHGAISRPIAPSTLAFCPPLVISDADIDVLVHALDAGVRAL